MHGPLHETATQNEYILLLEQWFSPAEIVRLVTRDNAQLLALSGLRSPIQSIACLDMLDAS